MNITKLQIKERNTKDITIDKTHRVVKNFVIQNSPFYDPDTLIENLRKEIVACKIKGKGASQELIGDFNKVSIALGLFTHIPVAETVKKEYRTFLVEMIKDIESEYDCKTAIEKALAEMIGSSYVRTVQYSKELTLCTVDKDLSHEKNGYYNILGKELDRANRNFLNASMTLKQLKNPLLDINIKTKNAFISQNQQFNNNQNTNND